MSAGGAEKILMECRICWHVYDPEQGDELGQIAARHPIYRAA